MFFIRSKIFYFYFIQTDVRGSELHKLDFIGLEFHQREVMQLKDYVIVVKHVRKYFQCLDLYGGIGVFGEAYGGYMALKLIAGLEVDKYVNDEGNKLFQCCAAIRPFTHWQNYIYPFSMKVRFFIKFLNFLFFTRNEHYTYMHKYDTINKIHYFL
jgi:dipeptidyl aminopeptidase/acylaminoacyl peptidase